MADKKGESPCSLIYLRNFELFEIPKYIAWMNATTLANFQLITAQHGEEKGGIYFDDGEDLLHKIYPDRILFTTNYMDDRAFILFLHEAELYLRRTREHDHKINANPIIIEDNMDEEDMTDFNELWRGMERQLIIMPKLNDLDVRTELKELFSFLFTEQQAEAFFKKIPAKKKPDVSWVWKQIALALEGSNSVVSFEWKEWAEIGIGAVADLPIVLQSGVNLPYPNDQEIAAVANSSNWDGAILQYFNDRLNAADLRLFAIGTHFDEYQMFLCLPTGDHLVNALEKFEKLGLVCKG